MSEVDVNTMALENADFSQLSNDMNKMEKDIQILLNIGYFLLGAVSTIGGVIGYKVISKCLKKNKVVYIKGHASFKSDNKISVISNIFKFLSFN